MITIQTGIIGHIRWLIFMDHPKNEIVKIIDEYLEIIPGLTIRKELNQLKTEILNDK